LGLSFKGGTDDLRESPLVLLAEKLIGKGYKLLIYDSNVSLARVVGSNREYIQKEIPHIEHLLTTTIDEVLRNSQVIVIGNCDNEYTSAVMKIRSAEIIDLARAISDPSKMGSNYHAICW
jgi:GDP-mannose 6-dehydrogenase